MNFVLIFKAGLSIKLFFKTLEKLKDFFLYYDTIENLVHNEWLVVSGKSLSKQQLGSMFYFMGVSHMLPVSDTITANSTQPPGSNTKLELLLLGSIIALKLFSRAIRLGDVCIYTWL